MGKTSQISTLDSESTANPSSGESQASAQAAPAVEAKDLKGIGNGDFSGKKAILTIAASPGENGAEAVFVSVGGVAFQIPRGKAWKVPVEVVHALEIATELTYRRNEQTGALEQIESPRYTFVSQPLAE